MKRILLASVMLAACSQQPDSNEASHASKNASQSKSEITHPAAKPFSVEEKTDLYEFDFSWPAEAAAIPELAGRLRSELEKAKGELTASSKEEAERREKENMEMTPFSSSTVYETAGQSARLLSLRVDAGGYTGGAHGNYGTAALLWDRQAKREINFADLFAERANRDRLLTQRWCDALGKAREEKRGEPAGGGGMFDDCPVLDDIAIMPTDSNKDGRFESLVLVASPYVAGPYVEGSYEIELAVTPDLVAGMKAEFQPSFTG